MKDFFKSTSLGQKIVGGLMALSVLFYLFYAISLVVVGSNNRISNAANVSAAKGYLTFIRKNENKEVAVIKTEIEKQQEKIKDTLEGNFSYRTSLELTRKSNYFSGLHTDLTLFAGNLEGKIKVFTDEKMDARYDLVAAQNSLTISRGNTALNLFSTFLQLSIVEGILILGYIYVPGLKKAQPDIL